MKAIGIVTDCVRFNQIFMNLLSNAVKFTPEKGKVEFIMEQIGENEGAAEIQFTVRDNGIGMSSDFIPRAFESFSQEYREDVAENCEGTGLGLSIVQELVKMMGGSIQMESVLNRGTVFKVFLPLQETDLCSGSQNVIEVDSDKLRGMHILLAEDNDLNKEIAVVMLEKKGCIVDWANNGRAVCDIFEKSPSGYYRIILMDVRMPYMDGLSASRNIRRMKRADAKSIPIISMSADAFVEDEKAAYEAGMNDCITKPVEAHRLYEICIKYA